MDLVYIVRDKEKKDGPIEAVVLEIKKEGSGDSPTKAAAQLSRNIGLAREVLSLAFCDGDSTRLRLHPVICGQWTQTLCDRVSGSEAWKVLQEAARFGADSVEPRILIHHGIQDSEGNRHLRLASPNFHFTSDVKNQEDFNFKEEYPDEVPIKEGDSSGPKVGWKEGALKGFFEFQPGHEVKNLSLEMTRWGNQLVLFVSVWQEERDRFLEGSKDSTVVSPQVQVLKELAKSVKEKDLKLDGFSWNEYVSQRLYLAIWSLPNAEPDMIRKGLAEVRQKYVELLVEGLAQS